MPQPSTNNSVKQTPRRNREDRNCRKKNKTGQCLTACQIWLAPHAKNGKQALPLGQSPTLRIQCGDLPHRRIRRRRVTHDVATIEVVDSRRPHSGRLMLGWVGLGWVHVSRGFHPELLTRTPPEPSAKSPRMGPTCLARGVSPENEGDQHKHRPGRGRRGMWLTLNGRGMSVHSNT
jgi:hypothetical protein